VGNRHRRFPIVDVYNDWKSRKANGSVKGPIRAMWIDRRRRVCNATTESTNKLTKRCLTSDTSMQKRQSKQTDKRRYLNGVCCSNQPPTFKTTFHKYLKKESRNAASTGDQSQSMLEVEGQPVLIHPKLCDRTVLHWLAFQDLQEPFCLATGKNVQDHYYQKRLCRIPRLRRGSTVRAEWPMKSI
jgi:hypothetical protein